MVPLFLCILTCAGEVYAWLRRSTGSLWPAVIAHMSFDLLLGWIESGTTTTQPAAVALVGRETGVATLIALGAAAIWSSRQRQLDSRLAGEAHPDQAVVAA